MQLRSYQQRAVDAAIASLRAGDNPVLQLATGTGKSIILSTLAAAFQRVWVLTHVQQLVEQNAATYEAVIGRRAGIICAGLGRSDRDAAVTFATVQSIMAPALKGELPKPDLIIIDEAHRVPHSSDEPSQYEKLLRAYPNAQRVAMTATPWRMDNGLIYGEGEQYWFNRLAFTYNVADAVREGWLSPLVGVETEVQLDLEGVTENDDYVMKEVGERETAKWLAQVAASVARLAATRKRVAVYCPTITAAMRAAIAISDVAGWKTEVITGNMSQAQRAIIFKAFRAGEVRVLCSVDTITTGFDLPALDCIVCLRPTLSSSLWVQIQGRGTRLFEGKKNCLLLDYVGNLQRLGGVDVIETFVREKNGEASEPIAAVAEPRTRTARRVLPGVKTLLPIDPMTGQQATDGSTLEVQVHAVSAVAIPTRRNPSAPVLLVQYTCTTAENARIDASLFITTERPTAADWQFFKRRSLAVNLPSPARQLLWQVRGAQIPNTVKVQKRGRYWNVIAESFPGDSN